MNILKTQNRLFRRGLYYAIIIIAMCLNILKKRDNFRYPHIFIKRTCQKFMKLGIINVYSTLLLVKKYTIPLANAGLPL